MIVIAATYSPVGRIVTPHLGGARKIELVISLLARLDQSILLVNSAHNELGRNDFRTRSMKIGGVEVTEMLLPTSDNRPIGKARNLLSVSTVVDRMLKIGQPRLLWLYNGYAFESLLGCAVAKRIGCPVVLEFEDWHFSRGRGLNPKPYIDWLLWRRLLPRVTQAFAVNTSLAQRLEAGGIPTELFPGIVSSHIEAMAVDAPPFSNASPTTVVGYFGGLSREKGADKVLALIPQVPDGFEFIVTGTGELEQDFKRVQALYPAKLRYLGAVEETELSALIRATDVLLNPHTPISAMSNGVFPFKVLEGVASGRLVISTSLPSQGLDNILAGVHFVEDSADALLEAVLSSRAIFLAKGARIKSGATEAIRRFGAEGLHATITRHLNWKALPERQA